MIEFYYKLVKAGKLAIEAVPAKYREAVRERMLNRGGSDVGIH